MLFPLITFLSTTTSLVSAALLTNNVAQEPFLNVLSSSQPSPFTLASLNEDAHTHFAHEAFPDHKIRIKATEGGWCDPGVKSYTGYIDVDSHGQSLFFYFFESRGDPKKDPVMLWTNGGPGASSGYGLFTELGPCRIDPASKDVVYNPDSWNELANIFFIDQPAGVGFSFSKNGQPVHSTTEQGAVDIQAFVTIFFETFSEFKGREFHMSGESYGGRYLPVYTSAIYDGNAYAAARNVTPINLRSVMIGNGWTDSYTMYQGYVDQQCTAGAGTGVIQSISTCVKLREALPRCLEGFKRECRDRFDLLGCGAAVDFCMSITIAPFQKLGRNWYDISEVCDPVKGCSDTSLTAALIPYLNSPKILKTLGIDPDWKGPWVPSSEPVARAFGGIGGEAKMDVHHKTYHYLEGLLERGVRVLVYAGKVDFACNYLGQIGMLHNLEWTGASSYRNSTERFWYAGGSSNASGKEIAGEVRTAGNGLTFATIRGAGHFVPLNKPKESLWMVERWLKAEEF
ncbi:Alpha/Beta hydrolase protein [Mrakia frigida]|uniref:S10 family peptidase n=1 Tax=Mrakia frigida TaxID=29902 RepID=UPI003FCBF8BE